MKLKWFWCVLLMFFSTSQLIGQTFTVSGYVVDKETGETIIGVNVIVQGTNRGAATDGNGYFRITSLSPGKYTLNVSHIAYQLNKVDILVGNKGLVLDDIPLDLTQEFGIASIN